MMYLADVASVIRSKNAGPFVVTFDVFLPDRTTYEAAKVALSPHRIADCFGLSQSDIQSYITFDLVYAIKFSIVRRSSSGSPTDRDVYGAQQYAPLLEVSLAV